MRLHLASGPTPCGRKTQLLPQMPLGCTLHHPGCTLCRGNSAGVTWLSNHLLQALTCGSTCYEMTGRTPWHPQRGLLLEALLELHGGW